MILAAGVGTRLRPLTEETPKALVRVGGKPLIEHVASRLIAAGADRLIINTHHHAEQIERYVSARKGFGIEVRFSREEEEPLETGGGLLAARPLFDGSAPFCLHNVDVISGTDLAALAVAHARNKAVATLVVSRRETSRPVLIDAEGFRGLANRTTGWRAEARAAVGATTEIGFAGIHMLSPQIFDLITERGRFSIMELYLRLAREGQRIATFDATGDLWLEVGDPARLDRANAMLSRLGGAP